MSELKKLLEGLPIKLVDKERAEIEGANWHRNSIQKFMDGPGIDPIERLAGRVILREMDEYEKTKPAPRKEAVAELARQEMLDGHYTCDPVKEPQSETDVFVAMPPKSERTVTMKVKREDPFRGMDWANIENAQRFGFPKGSLIQCLLDLRDEVRRLKEPK